MKGRMCSDCVGSGQMKTVRIHGYVLKVGFTCHECNGTGLALSIEDQE